MDLPGPKRQSQYPSYYNVDHDDPVSLAMTARPVPLWKKKIVWIPLAVCLILLLVIIFGLSAALIGGNMSSSTDKSGAADQDSAAGAPVGAAPLSSTTVPTVPSLPGMILCQCCGSFCIDTYHALIYTVGWNRLCWHAHAHELAALCTQRCMIPWDP